MAKAKTDEFDRVDMAEIVAEMLRDAGITKKQVMAVYRATSKAMAQGLADKKRIEIFEWLVADMKFTPGRPYNITTPAGTPIQGTSAGFFKISIRPHRRLRVNTQVIVGEKVK